MSSATAPPRFGSAIEGTDLCDRYGSRVVSSTASNGRVVAVKVKNAKIFARSEADMMNYASRQPGLLAPRVLGCYDVGRDVTVMVSDVVPGVALDTVWHTMSKMQKKIIAAQLKAQLRIIRSCTQSYIGRVNHKPTLNFYECNKFVFMGPFNTPAEFDQWCLARVKSTMGRIKWNYLIPRMQKKSSKEFVLTHGDLAPWNIMVENGRITGIVDWEFSGFFPDYMEYALAMQMCDFHDDIGWWWKPVLKEALEPCSPQRVKFLESITNRWGY